MRNRRESHGDSAIAQAAPEFGFAFADLGVEVARRRAVACVATLRRAQAREVRRYPMGRRIREVEQGPDGALWLLEDGGGGRLLKLTPNRS